jgi:peptidoglycan/LPS O-acetylase OafA/YrhL
MNTALRHRTDIDGLRAVAILPILLFHAGVSALAGGFVGVDIFFVISGFLITSIIVREIDGERFSLIEFYRRRVVRIFPALFVVCALSLAWGAWRLLPSEFERLAHSTMAALAFASNIHFWLVADYFAPEAELMPLLHTWSLGVEEQFYIFFPLAMLLVARFARRWLLPLLAIAAALSFAGGWFVALQSPVAAFYLLPVRAWELLAGSLVAVSGIAASTAATGPRWSALREGAALLGALLLVAAVLFVRDGPAFPVPEALVPALGAALVIAFGEGTLVGRGLSLSVLRYIGRISYSTYLWHWPLIAFWRIETGIELDLAETAALVAASLAAGALSYHLVEKPFMDRYRKHGSSARIVAVGFAGLAAGVAGAVVLLTTAPHWRRIDPQAERIAAYDDYIETPQYQYQFRRGPCFRGEAQADIAFEPAECVGLSDTKPNVVVVGDSYAAQYWRAVALELPDANVMQASASGCRPLIGTGGDARCREVADYVLGPLLATGKVDSVVLAGRWLPEDLSAIAPTIDHIQSAGARVVFIGGAVEYQGAFPAILARAVERGDPSLVDRWRVNGAIDWDRKLEAIVKPTGALYVSPLRTICAPECRLTAPGGAPMQFDYGHLTLPGARFVIQQIPPAEIAPQ